MIDLNKDWKDLPSRVEATKMRAAREMDRPPSPDTQPGRERARDGHCNHDDRSADSMPLNHLVTGQFPFKFAFQPRHGVHVAQDNRTNNGSENDCAHDDGEHDVCGMACSFRLEK